MYKRQIDINNYCKWITKRDGTKLRRWDMEKLRGTEIEKVLNEAFSCLLYTSMYLWSQNPKDRKELLTAIYLYVYLNRKEEDR